MMYNTHIRIPDASRECGWTQVWLDSFESYDDAVRFIRSYRSNAMPIDRLLAVTANESNGVYDEKETLLAAGALESDAGIGIVSDEEISVKTCNGALYAIDLMDMRKYGIRPFYVFERIRDSQIRKDSFGWTMLSINIDILKTTLEMNKECRCEYAESKLTEAEELLSGKINSINTHSSDFWNIIHRTAFCEDVAYAAKSITFVTESTCLTNCCAAMSKIVKPSVANKILTEIIFRHITVAQAFCDVFFLGEQR